MNNKNNKNKIKKRKEYEKQYNIKNGGRIKAYKKEYRRKNKDKIKDYKQKWRKDNKDKIREKNKEYREKYKDKIKKYKKEWYEKNKSRINEQHKEYNKKNREERRKQIRKYIRKKYKEDKNFRMATLLRGRINVALKKYSEGGKIMSSKEYGINYKKIIEHLKPFPKDIENYEVDHIIPLSWFNLNDMKEVKWAFAPENHQWMLKTENRKKSNKFIEVVKK